MKNRDLLKELREMTDADLKEKINDLKEEIFNVRFKLVTDHSGDFTRIKYNKRVIARIKTIIRERELASK